MAGRTPGDVNDLCRARLARGPQARLLSLWALLNLLLATPAVADVTLTLAQDTVENYTGRVYLAAAQGRREPRHGNWWFDPNPLFFVDVTDWTPGAPLTLGDDTPGHPVKRLGDLPAGDWSLQAVIRTGDRNAGPLSGPGTVYSLPVRTKVADSVEAAITLDRTEPSRSAISPGTGMELFEVHSPLLSEHFGTPFTLRAVIRLPEGTDSSPEAAAKLPTLYHIGGFPGALRSANLIPWLYGRHDEADQLAIVHLEAEHRGGHSAFVDSAAGGPWGTALVTELIPALEAKFPLQSRTDGRFLTGHSSGGWASLWLALEHPNVFGGTVSTAPDPVDFSRFQTVDLYAPDANLYRSVEGERAAVARTADGSSTWMDEFVAMESAMGEGGQMRSFEWTFSPVGEDGLPKRLWNRDTGEVDPTVAAHWRRFDIADRVQRQWSTLEPILRDRVLIVMGDADTFHLEGAARQLDELLTARGLPHVVEIIPGDHSSILDAALSQRILQRALQCARGGDASKAPPLSPS
ncbi:MAG: alpha/beta hydrolase-fold protein [Phycisphaerales bacterium]|nr:alpha/beta hydrolase-fold protein [Phycisphaerales bacterium]